MTPNASGTSVRVKLTGPFSSTSEQTAPLPGALSSGTPIMPQMFELEGKDGSGVTMVTYGFLIKKWFISRGSFIAPGVGSNSQDGWCTSIGATLPSIHDYTNSTGTDGWVGYTLPTPPLYPSSGNHYMRAIGAGFLSEWGVLSDYSGVDWSNQYLATSTMFTRLDGWLMMFGVVPYFGQVIANGATNTWYGGCIYE